MVGEPELQVGLIRTIFEPGNVVVEHESRCHVGQGAVCDECRFIDAIRIELKRARAKFPTNEANAVALLEEAGEVGKALLEHKYDQAPAEGVYDESVQLAVMALRVALEGDASFPYTLQEAGR